MSFLIYHITDILRPYQFLPKMKLILVSTFGSNWQVSYKLIVCNWPDFLAVSSGHFQFTTNDLALIGLERLYTANQEWFLFETITKVCYWNKASATMKQCRVYRVRTTGYTVRYNQWGPKPHTRGSILYSTYLSQIGNMIMINMTKHMWWGNLWKYLIHSHIPHTCWLITII